MYYIILCTLDGLGPAWTANAAEHETPNKFKD